MTINPLIMTDYSIFKIGERSRFSIPYLRYYLNISAYYKIAMIFPQPVLGEIERIRARLVL
tara:strand:+ start:15891 stop:16073 length:183 start_codon:yes stop_codon:yes gene_type:complete